VNGPQSPDWPLLVVSLAGGLALFLIGMDQMTDALKALAGHRLQRVLQRLSSNRVMGAATGAVATAALQSSSVTTVLTVGFVSAELLTLAQAASVVIGANLGTTITAQVIALNVTQFSLGLVAVGAVLWLFVRRPSWLETGRALAALGLVFLGLEVMGEAMSPLASYQPILDVLSGSGSPLAALLAGAALTALIQSSSATTGIVITMAATGLIDLRTGIAIILGANIGTCVTVLIAAIGKGREALRTALVHVTVNLLGALVWLVLLPVLAGLVELISGDSAALASPRELANAHTLFNGINTVVFLILLSPLLVLIRRIVPERPEAPVEVGRSAFLDEDVTGTATLGLSAVDREIDRLLDEVTDYFDAGFRACALDDPWEDDTAFNDWVEEGKDSIRQHQRAIVGYLGAVSTSARDEEQSAQLLAYVGEADELAHLADLLASGFRRVHRRRHRNGVTMPKETADVLVRMQETTSADAGSARISPRPESVRADIEEERELAGARLARWFVRTRDVDAYVVVTDLLDLIDRVRISADRLAVSPARQVRSG